MINLEKRIKIMVNNFYDYKEYKLQLEMIKKEYIFAKKGENLMYIFSYKSKENQEGLIEFIKNELTYCNYKIEQISLLKTIILEIKGY